MWLIFLRRGAGTLFRGSRRPRKLGTVGATLDGFRGTDWWDAVQSYGRAGRGAREGVVRRRCILNAPVMAASG